MKTQSITFIVILVVLLVVHTAALPRVANFEIREDETVSVPVSEQPKEMTLELPGKQLVRFSFKDCGGPDAMASISSLDITPDPLSFPGPLNVAATFKVNSPLASPLEGDALMEEKIDGEYEKIDCEDGFGSCSYGDLCALLEPIKKCPDALLKIGIDCHCPIKANSYSPPLTRFNINTGILPVDEYHLAGNVTSNGQLAACVDLMVTVNSYTLPLTKFDITEMILPSCEFHLVGNVTSNGQVAACLDVYATVV